MAIGTGYGKPAGGAGLLATLGRWLLRLALALLGLWVALMLVYRWIDPPLTPLMLLRLPAEHRIMHLPVPYSHISPELAQAVIASEDNRFCLHHGVDFDAVQDAVDDYSDGGRLRGASTITMQTARNVFLWPGGGFLRKAVEIPLALALDILWPKHRIMDVYLNSIEWGDGIYGAEAAAMTHFHKHASALDRPEAALLAAVLPNPRRWSAAHPTAYIRQRADIISRRIGRLGGYFTCLRD